MEDIVKGVTQISFLLNTLISAVDSNKGKETEKSGGGEEAPKSKKARSILVMEVPFSQQDSSSSTSAVNILPFPSSHTLANEDEDDGTTRVIIE